MCFEERCRNFWEVGYPYGPKCLVAMKRGIRAFLLDGWTQARSKNGAGQWQPFCLLPLEPMCKFIFYTSKSLQYVHIDLQFNIFSTPSLPLLLCESPLSFPDFCKNFLKSLFSLLPPSLSSVYVRHKSKNRPTNV